MNYTDLLALRDRTAPVITAADGGFRVVVGLATCGMAAGAGPVMDAFKEYTAGMDNVRVELTGCIGICQYEPIVEIYEEGKPKVTYVKMTPDRARRVVEEHIRGGKPVEEFMLTENGKPAYSIDDTTFMKKQVRIALRNCGVINPEDIDEYIARDGYQALRKALTEMTPDEVIDVVYKSGLRGRGGAGFPTGLKWKLASDNRGKVKKYVCCNADEGDPGAFMDRSLLEGDPHAIIEAMAIAAYAIGADEGYIYVRAEYPTAIKRLQIAIDQAKEYGLLGQNIFGTGFNFELSLRFGAGAFVCGEETSLMTSIEGKRGEPRPRPPFPATKGLFDQPTVLNNVETYANIPQIILRGADWFASYGTEKSKGTKVFALGGKINNTGLIEIPMGMPLREIIYEIGGGIPNGKELKAVQTGGPSGGCIPARLIDTPVDYDSLAAIGCIIGSGGMIVIDEDNCMVDIARFFLEFTVDESCGKCTPCRIGMKRTLEMLDKIIDGKATEKDLARLEELSDYVKTASLCGLGQTAPNPVISTLRFFHDEYEAHIKDRRCPAHVCKRLVQFIIDPAKCTGCTKCARKCPTSAISGKVREPHVIDQSKCIKCGVCMDNCAFGAISKN